MSINNLVEVRNLTKIFPRSTSLLTLRRKKRVITAVNNISFKIKDREIVGLLGPNGAGKTTTIQMLLGLITPTSGEIIIFGKNFINHRKEILRQINFSSSYTHLPWRLTVWENLYVVARLYGIASPNQKIETIINLLHLSNKKDTEVGDLSSGWITRLNLARTFINNPRFILLDEPTASLDPEGADEIRTQILRLRKELGSTILWTSHNMAEVEEVCDRVIFLNRGKIIAQDTPEQLARKIRNVRINLLIEKGNQRLIKIIKENNWSSKISGRFTIIETMESDIPHLLNLLAVQKIHYSQITIDKPTLEDFFLTMAKTKEN